MVTDFLVQIGENWHTAPSVCSLTFHTGWEDRNKDARVNTADDPSTSDKHLVNFSPVTPRLCRAGYKLGFATYF